MRRFLNGIIMGSFLGAIVGLMANGNMKPQRKRLLGQTKQMTKQASDVMNIVSKNVTQGVNRFMKKR